jgi:predicted secreted acid phosphatase
VNRPSPRAAGAAAALLALLTVAGCVMPESSPSGSVEVSEPVPSGSSSPTPAPTWPGGDENQQEDPVEPLDANLSDIKDELKAYHDSGEYEEDVAAMADDAQRCMLEEREGVAKPALVLDIDETALSNYAWMVSVDFLRNSPLLTNLFTAQAGKQNTPALAPTLKLYRAARQVDISVFFISGRGVALQEVTEANLRKVGYTDWEGATFHPAGGAPQPSVVPFKSAARKAIEEQGYTIIANVGDQNSDLEGGFGACQHKLPNPYYYIP